MFKENIRNMSAKQLANNLMNSIEKGYKGSEMQGSMIGGLKKVQKVVLVVDLQGQVVEVAAPVVLVEVLGVDLEGQVVVMVEEVKEGKIIYKIKGT